MQLLHHIYQVIVAFSGRNTVAAAANCSADINAQLVSDVYGHCMVFINLYHNS